MKNKRSISKVRHQSGAVLVISLLILMMLTMLAVAGMRGSSLQEIMAGNSRETALAFASAEAALRDGEAWIGGSQLLTLPSVDSSCAHAATPCKAWVSPTTGLWLTGSGSSRYHAAVADGSWWQDNGIAFGSTAAADNPRVMPTVAEQPRYVVEQIGFKNFTNSPLMDSTNTYEYFYQITARGGGKSGLTSTVVQSTYGRVF